ncbi:hypothetical protein [Methylobacterium ajmalii]|uniref:hypothetical protein n=1 Tax=Methylobacterium ajmalii TaxID=2738439 RepID=UPI00190CDF5C|nr:hypothetical protein [Methylobacterium ajmalii]MBK3397765.1 hypothetical protein [Methylobacterium ajmalii]MBK3408464.1 hypothetical protein [Methylobacterium ajmalii]MBK3424135.1 hypothetical protein [Methylobacterium ajmalii]MBZ6416612.1 hypothetical protein [Methylobacterium sp.]
MKHPKPNCIICRDGTGIRVEARDGALVVTALARDGLRATSGLGAYESVGGEIGLEARHVGVPVAVVRDYVRAHHGVEAIHPAALAILRGEQPPAPAAVLGGEEAAPPRPFHPRWPSLPPPRLLEGRAGWWTTSPRP